MLNGYVMLLLSWDWEKLVNSGSLRGFAQAIFYANGSLNSSSMEFHYHVQMWIFGIIVICMLDTSVMLLGTIL